MQPSPVLVTTFIGALQGSISVLLTLLPGYLSARWGVIDHPTAKSISDLCSSLFLPCLIIVQTGPELTVAELRRLWIIPVWGLLSTIIAHLIGWAGQHTFRLPYWTILAAGRPDSNSIPFLLLQSLKYTGVIDALKQPGEDAGGTLRRAQTYVLLNAVVQQTFTFQLGPAIISRDRQRKNNSDRERSEGELGIARDSERAQLLHTRDAQSYGTLQDYPNALRPLEDIPRVQRPAVIRRLVNMFKLAMSYLSPPLIGALIALFLGVSHILRTLTEHRNN